MRTLTLASSFVVLALIAVGCTQETAPSTSRLRKPGTPAPGGNNPSTEHGDNTPAGPQETPDEGTPVTANETWQTGKKIESNITITPGITIEIAPGAIVSVSNDVTITVKGTLKVAAATNHAKLTGQNWAGIIIDQGGTLAADGLDFENAQSALWTKTGNTDATLTNGVIKGATPFKMEVGSKLNLVKTLITSTSGSTIAGTFTASRMTYNKSGGGIGINDPAATVTISDSVLKGASGSDNDFIIAGAAKLLKIEYSELSQTHCALHFSGIEQYQLDHVSLVANSYGAMLYGSGAGPHTVTSSNVDNNTDKGLDMTGTNGPLTVTKSYTTKNVLQPNATETEKAAATIPDAKPRPAS